MTTYIVCQNGNCAQPYPISYFGVVTPKTANIDCPICGSVLVDENGRGNLSSIPVPVHYMTPQDMKNMEKREKQELADKREEVARLQRDIEELECNHED